MSIKDLFNHPAFKEIDKLLVGFEEQFQSLGKQLEASVCLNNYPPCNIRRTADATYIIELALAGYALQDLDVELADSKLVVRGNLPAPDVVDESYIVKGIARRPFTRSFVLSDQVEVKSAELENGMLRIVLQSLAPREQAPRKVPVSAK